MRKKREIVLEVERVRIVRRKARTSLVFCRGCGREADFIGLAEAAALFAAPRAGLLRFARAHGCHFETAPGGGIELCLDSLLARLRAGGGARLGPIGGAPGEDAA